MHKLTFTIILVLGFGTQAFSQKDTLSVRDKAMLDSMMKNDPFFSLMNEKPKNSIDVSIGFGNGSFSEHNRAVNATGVTNQLIYTPGVTYRFKNGINVGLVGYLTKDSANKLELYQTGLTAGYDYQGDKVSAGGSFTRYFSDMNKFNSKSLYQNDLYAYVKKSSGIIQPVLALGCSSGKFKAIDLVRVIRPIQMDTIYIKDSTENKASYFYLSAGIQHDFNFYAVFAKGDELDFTPALVINAGADKTSSTVLNKNFAQFLSNKPKLANRLRMADSNKFQLQSIAMSFDLTYSIRKFYFQPNLYIDYYLPSTTAKRLSAVYSLTAGFTF
jgi:hypothetical protein